MALTGDISEGRRIGYARVSTADQELTLQLDALRLAGCAEIFEEKASGSNRLRPALDEALAALKPGDVLVVWKLDRLARSLRDLLNVLEELRERKVKFESLTERFDTFSAFGEFALHILGAVAQLERNIISERTTAGVGAAREGGQRLGRPPKLADADILAAYNRIVTEKAEFDALADELGVHPITLERAFQKLIAAEGPE